MQRTNSWAVAVSVLTLLSAVGSAAAPATRIPGDRAATELALIDWTVQKPVVRDAADGSASLRVVLGGVSKDLVLRPHSLRSPDFRVLVPDEAGGLKSIPAPAPRTYRGTTADGDVVAATKHDEGWELMVAEADGDVWFAEPEARFDPAAEAGSLVVYHTDDAVLPAGRCGADDMNPDAAPVHNAAARLIAEQSRTISNLAREPGDTTESPAGGVLRVADLGIDCDNQFYTRNGSNTSTVTTVAEAVVNNVNVIYNRDVNVQFIISGIVIRSVAASDPFTVTDGGALLDQMRSVWVGGGTGITHDLAHLFSGKNFNGSTLGVAFLSGLCGSQRYGVNEVLFSSSANSRAALVAHESGHLFSAQHCDGINPCNIMCSGINGCNGLGLPNFASVSIDRIAPFAVSAGCLVNGGGSFLPLPSSEPFETGSFNDNFWQTTGNAAIVNRNDNPPSPPFVMELDVTDTVTTEGFAARNPTNEPVFLSFWFRRVGVAAGNTLLVQSASATGSFSNFGTLTSDGNTMTAYERVQFQLPARARVDGARLRLVVDGRSGDDWLIDDIRVGTIAPCGNPADIAVTFGVLDINDVLGFAGAFNVMAPLADFSPPGGNGVFDINDILVFAEAFAQGCP